MTKLLTSLVRTPIYWHNLSTDSGHYTHSFTHIKHLYSTSSRKLLSQRCSQLQHG